MIIIIIFLKHKDIKVVPGLEGVEIFFTKLIAALGGAEGGLVDAAPYDWRLVRFFPIFNSL
jgi:hypothetical protein